MMLWADFDQTTWQITLLISLVVFVPLAALLIAISVWSHRRAEFLLQQWADRNDLRMLEKEERKLFRGPFLWNSSRGQMVYRVTVEDKAGNTYSGFVCLGSRFRGIFSDQAEVEWD
jgi:hypothetical protein